MNLRETYRGNTPEAARHRQTLTVSTSLASIVASLLVIAAFVPLWSKGLQPIFVEAVAQEASEELDEKVRAAVDGKFKPLELKVEAGNAGIKAVILGNIMELENAINELQYKRDHGDNGDWTSSDARSLLSKRRQLSTQREALAAIQAAENGV